MGARFNLVEPFKFDADNEQEWEAEVRQPRRAVVARGPRAVRPFRRAVRPRPGRPRPGKRLGTHRLPRPPFYRYPRPRFPYPWLPPAVIVRDRPPSQPAAAPSEYVRWVQSSLNAILGLRLPLDGVMGPETRSAIRSFQQKQGLPADGIVGPDTEQALIEARRAGTLSRSRELEQEQFLGPLGDYAGQIWDAVSGRPRIQDRTHLTPKDKRIRQRDPKTAYALVLHQMAFSRGSDPTRYDRVTAHYAILPDGQILQLHPISAYLYASNGFNKHSIAVEFAGNFPNTRGRCWQASKYGCHKLTPAQIQAGRDLIRYLIRENGLTHVLAHRQSSGTRENDPGPDIWYHVGQWAIENLGLKDGGPGFKISSGNPIPDQWRNWGRR